MCCILELSDDEVIINSIIFLLAAYDTTATTLAWMVYELVLNPDVQQKLVDTINEEIGDVGEVHILITSASVTVSFVYFL